MLPIRLCCILGAVALAATAPIATAADHGAAPATAAAAAPADSAFESGLLRVQTDHLVPRVQVILAVLPAAGIVLRPASLGDRTGFGVALDFVPPPLRGWLRLGLDGSTLGYDRGRVEVGPRWLAAGYVYDWRPQQPFYGTGPDSRARDASSYATQSQRAELRLQLRSGGKLRRELAAWYGERQSVLHRGRDHERPSFDTVFPQDATGTLDVRQDQFVSGARLAADTREGHPHWSRGWRLSAQTERFGISPPGHGVLFAGSDASPTFHRYTLEAEAGWSFMRDPRTLRLSMRVADVKPADPARPPTLLDVSQLGGGAGLAGFEPGRFHGLDALAAKLGYYFPLAAYVELEVAVEAGAVSGDVWRETRMDRLERSYTVMLRPRNKLAPFGAVGVSWSREGARAGFALGGVE
jgi:hypothetical protein